MPYGTMLQDEMVTAPFFSLRLSLLYSMFGTCVFVSPLLPSSPLFSSHLPRLLSSSRAVTLSIVAVHTQADLCAGVSPPNFSWVAPTRRVGDARPRLCMASRQKAAAAPVYGEEWRLPPSSADDCPLPLTADGKLHLMINSRITGPAAEAHRKAVASTSKRFGEKLVCAALRDGRTYAHLSLVYDFYLDPSQLPRLEAALHTFAAGQHATPLSLLQPAVFDDRVVSLHLDVQSGGYATARKIYDELISTLAALAVIPAKRLDVQVPWHATIAMRDEGDGHDLLAEAMRHQEAGL